jgi:hypothetical protein
VRNEVLPILVILLTISFMILWLLNRNDELGLIAWLGVASTLTALMAIYLTSRHFRISSKQQEARFSEESRLRVMPCLTLECKTAMGHSPRYAEMTFTVECVSDYPAFSTEFFTWNTVEKSKFDIKECHEEKDKVPFPIKTYSKDKKVEIKCNPFNNDCEDDGILIIIADYKDCFMNLYTQMFKQEKCGSIHFIALPPQLVIIKERT